MSELQKWSEIMAKLGEGVPIKRPVPADIALLREQNTALTAALKAVMETELTICMLNDCAPSEAARHVNDGLLNEWPEMRDILNGKSVVVPREATVLVPALRTHGSSSDGVAMLTAAKDSEATTIRCDECNGMGLETLEDDEDPEFISTRECIECHGTGVVPVKDSEGGT